MSKNHGKLYYDLLDDNLSKSAIVFFTLLLSNSNQKGYAFGSNKYYADKLKCSTKTISALIRSLIDKGYITSIRDNVDKDYICQKEPYKD